MKLRLGQMSFEPYMILTCVCMFMSQLCLKIGHACMSKKYIIVSVSNAKLTAKL